MYHQADSDIDRLVSKYARMNLPLRDVRIRRPSKYDEQMEERVQKKKTYLSDLQAMLDSGFDQPKHKTEQ